VDIKKGDTVEVLSGSDRGKRGVVLRALPKEEKLVVEGVSLRKKHSRQTKQTGSGRAIKGGTVEFPAPIHISNVMLVCPKCDKLTRVTRRSGENGRVRICKSCENPLDAVGK
jgi:large subunit ribosomal protein L24